MIMSLTITVVKDTNFNWITEDEMEERRLFIHDNVMTRTRTLTAPCGQGTSMGDDLEQAQT